MSLPCLIHLTEISSWWCRPQNFQKLYKCSRPSTLFYDFSSEICLTVAIKSKQTVNSCICIKDAIHWSKSKMYHRIIWIRRDFQRSSCPTLLQLKAHLQLHQVAQCPLLPDLEYPKDRASTTSQGNLFQHFTTHTVKHFRISNLNPPFFSLKPFLPSYHSSLC